ncbi:hypothetical protein L9F63_009632, partial [Diploptera punctata]
MKRAQILMEILFLYELYLLSTAAMLPIVICFHYELKSRNLLLVSTLSQFSMCM